MTTLVDARSRQLSVTDRLPLKLIPQEGLTFDEPLGAAWLDGEVLRVTRKESVTFSASAPGRARLDVQPLAPVSGRPPILIRGKVELSVDTSCVRCLNAIQAPVEAEIETTLFPAQQGTGAELLAQANGELEDWAEEFPNPDELDEGSYAGEEIDLPEIVREAVLLSLAMNPVCADEEACTERTQHLLEEANRAAREADSRPDPRFDALRALAAKMQN